MKKLTKLKTTNFVGDVNKDLITEFQRAHWGDPPFTIGTRAVDTDFALVVNALNHTVASFTGSLGLDVNKRMINDERIILCSTEDYDLVTDKFSVSKDSSGFFDNVSRTVWVRESSDLYRLCLRLNHEIIHAISYCEVRFSTNDGGYYRMQEGLFLIQEDKNDWRYFNEALTEMLNIHLAKRLWRYPLPDLRRRFVKHQVDISYPDQIVLVHELIKELAVRNSVRYKKMFYYFVRAMLFGDLSKLKIIEDTFGRNAYLAYANISGDKRLDIIDWFDAISMDSVSYRLKEYRDNHWNYSALSWL